MIAQIVQFAPIITALATLSGLVFIFIQLRHARRLATADFGLRLVSEFADHHSKTYRKFLDREYSPASPQEWLELEDFLSFFESLEVLHQQRLIDFALIDRLFGFRFFVVADHPAVAEFIEKERQSWVGLTSLVERWQRFRAIQRRG